jgi:uncharacterized membrane protein YGL010W
MIEMTALRARRRLRRGWLGRSGFEALFEEYGSQHAARGNRICHAFGITLIVFGALSMLLVVTIHAPWTAAEALILAAGVFYVSRDPAVGLATIAAAVLLDLAARGIGDWRVGAAAFAVGWVFQAIGHAVYEKRSPAFFHNLAHLLIGPAFMVNEALHIRRAPTTRA